jgi:hypothetical protein
LLLRRFSTFSDDLGRRSGAARGIRTPDPIITNYINRMSRIVQL